jgi:hypothetical protein
VNNNGEVFEYALNKDWNKINFSEHAVDISVGSDGIVFVTT